MSWTLEFISRSDLSQHVEETIKMYEENLQPITLARFNSNVIDPIKLLFDKYVYDLSWDELFSAETLRQRDKTNNNSIGYFHQKLFGYIQDCTIPSSGWDVILSPPGGLSIAEAQTVSTLFVEMKNKHNTMNSSSAQKTYIRMQDQLLHNDDCACALVEVIARKSQDIPWVVSIDKTKRQHKLIRRMSIDRFYELVTGDPNAFCKLCLVLPEVIEEVVSRSKEIQTPIDTALHELKREARKENLTIEMALMFLGFGDYLGFTEPNAAPR